MKETSLNSKTADKIYRIIKNNSKAEDVCELLDCSMLELKGIVEFLNTFGKNIDLTYDEKNGAKVIKRVTRKSEKFLKDELKDLTLTKIGIVSDTHLGNNHQQLHLLNEAYKMASEREVPTMLHVGDMVDGDYTDIRKEQFKELFLFGYDEQAGYVTDMYPEVDGITTYYILGSHDETHYKRDKATINFLLDRTRKDMVYLGQDVGYLNLNGVKITLDHPGGGSSKGLSYKPQTRIEELSTGYKPNILLIGHYHKSYYFTHRNVRGILVPALCGKTKFQQKMGLKNVIGVRFLDIYSNNKGEIEYFKDDEILFDEEKYGWDEAGKDSKKVKRLVLK